MFTKRDFFEDVGGVSAVIAGTAGKQIRVRRWCLMADVSGQALLVSDPNGSAQSNLTATFYFASGQPIDVALAERDALTAAMGKDLGLSVTLPGFSGDYSLSVWYDLV